MTLKTDKELIPLVRKLRDYLKIGGNNDNQPKRVLSSNNTAKKPKNNVFYLHDKRSLLDRKRDEKRRVPTHTQKKRIEEKKCSDMLPILHGLRAACPAMAKALSTGSRNDALKYLHKADDSTPTCAGKFHLFIMAEIVVRHWLLDNPFCISPSPDRVLDSLRHLWLPKMLPPATFSKHWSVTQYDDEEIVLELDYMRNLHMLAQHCQQVRIYKWHQNQTKQRKEQEQHAHQMEHTRWLHNRTMQEMLHMVWSRCPFCGSYYGCYCGYR